MRDGAQLYLREAIGKLAHRAADQHVHSSARTSRGRDDYRPEVHDSDGLSIQPGDGEWIWRPLVNPRRLLGDVASRMTNPRGFGLMQRDRVARELRGSGSALRAAAERVGRADRQLGRRAASSWCRSRRPTRPTTTSSPSGCREAPPAAGKPLDIAYQAPLAGRGQRLPAGKGWVVQTRRGRGFVQQGRRRHPVRRRFRRPGAALACRRRPTSSR